MARGAAAAAALALLASPAPATFDYIPPLDTPVFQELEEETGTLADTLTRLAPEGSTLRWDRRVDPNRPIENDYADWENLLWGEGLAWTQDGEDLVIRPTGLDPVEIEHIPPAERTADWTMVSGELLHDVLDRWGSRAGVGIVWLTDRRWRLDETRVFQGRFVDATRSLLFALSHLSYAPVAEISADGRSITVVHRGPPLPVEETP